MRRKSIPAAAERGGGRDDRVLAGEFIRGLSVKKGDLAVFVSPTPGNIYLPLECLREGARVSIVDLDAGMIRLFKSVLDGEYNHKKRLWSVENADFTKTSYREKAKLVFIGAVLDDPAVDDLDADIILKKALDLSEGGNFALTWYSPLTAAEARPRTEKWADSLGFSLSAYSRREFGDVVPAHCWKVAKKRV